MKMLYNKRQPMFNRAVKAKYPPGSTFKLVQGGSSDCKRACSRRRTATPATADSATATA